MLITSERPNINLEIGKFITHKIIEKISLKQNNLGATKHENLVQLNSFLLKIIK